MFALLHALFNKTGHIEVGHALLGPIMVTFDIFV